MYHGATPDFRRWPGPGPPPAHRRLAPGHVEPDTDGRRRQLPRLTEARAEGRLPRGPRTPSLHLNRVSGVLLRQRLGLMVDHERHVPLGVNAHSYTSLTWVPETARKLPSAGTTCAAPTTSSPSARWSWSGPSCPPGSPASRSTRRRRLRSPDRPWLVTHAICLFATSGAYRHRRQSAGTETFSRDRGPTLHLICVKIQHRRGRRFHGSTAVLTAGNVNGLQGTPRHPPIFWSCN